PISPGHNLLLHFGWQRFPAGNFRNHGFSLLSSQATERKLRKVRARPPRWRELGPTRQDSEHPAGGNLLQVEGEQLQRGGIGPVQIFPGPVPGSPLGLLYEPRYQGFLGLLFLFLGTQGQRGSTLRMREREQRSQEWEGLGLGKAIRCEGLSEFCQLSVRWLMGSEL